MCVLSIILYSVLLANISHSFLESNLPSNARSAIMQAITAIIAKTCMAAHGISGSTTVLPGCR